ncbi:30S ribosomal protein S6 [Candidatus Daviesbacteria bacterium]|nr:30S ribosomal protein S6 [Candidatus Daviesbacteria bacterium]
MNNYYLTLVLKPDLEEKERKTLLDGVIKKLVGSEGKMDKEDLWGARDLAYPIKRQTKGFYAHFEIQTDPKNAKGLDKTLKLEEDILRYLLVRI